MEQKWAWTPYGKAAVEPHTSWTFHWKHSTENQRAGRKMPQTGQPDGRCGANRAGFEGRADWGADENGHADVSRRQRLPWPATPQVE